MASLREWLLRVWGSLYGGRSDPDLEEELRFHLDSATEDARRRDNGAEASDPVRRACLCAGRVAQSVELMRDQQRWPWLDDATRDLRQTFRMLTKARGFATVTVLTLGLGIAASTVMFSVFNAVVLQPLPYRDPANLVMVWIDDVKRQLHQTLVPYPVYVEWKDRSRGFSDLGFSTPNTPVTVSGAGEAERLDAVRATASMFTVLGVSRIEGRSYSAQEERNGDSVAVISRVLAERRFGGANAAVGRVMRIDGELTTVIGVMPAWFAFPAPEIQIWRPLGERRARVMVVARFADGVQLPRVRQDMNAIGQRLAEVYPELAADPDFPGFATNLVRLDDYVAGRDTRTALWILVAAALLMMAIACTNVGTLLLTRAAARRRERILQIALGATRGRLVRQMLIESAVLGLLSAVVGVVSAEWLLKVLVGSLGATIPRSDAVVLDRYVLAFATCLAIASTVFLGIVSAWRIDRPSLQSARREDGRSHGVGAQRRRLQQVLIVAEVGLTLSLVCGAGLVLRSLGEVRRLPLGFDTDNTLLFRMVVPNEFSTQQRRQFFDEATSRLRRLPGVRTAGVIGSLLPVSAPNTGVVVEGGIEPARGHVAILDDVISPETFSALRVVLRDGRLFNHEDTADSTPVAIINERFAREFWGDRPAVGKRFRFLDERSGGEWVTVVGVVGDMRRRRLEDEPGAQVFQPFSQAPSRGADVVIRTEVSPLSLAGSVTRTIAAIDAGVPVYRMSTLSERLDEFVTTRRFHVVLLSLFAGAGVLLAAIGIYGLIRQDVSQRTQEIGVRVALGASRRDVVSLVLRRGLVLTGVGMAVGWCASLAMAGIMGSLVYGVSPRDPLTFLVAPIVMFGIAVIACLEPTWRALRLDVFKALRPE
jgi:putative ABC transport system permease protein